MSKKCVTKKSDFPKTLFVYRERDSSDATDWWFCVGETLDDCVSTKKNFVAMYERKSVVSAYLKEATEIITKEPHAKN